MIKEWPMRVRRLSEFANFNESALSNLTAVVAFIFFFVLSLAVWPAVQLGFLLLVLLGLALALLLVLLLVLCVSECVGLIAVLIVQAVEEEKEKGFGIFEKTTANDCKFVSL